MSPPSGINCREFVEFLMSYLDGELEADVRASFEQHMGLCPPCEVYLKTYEETVRLSADLAACDDELPPDVPETLVQAVLRARREAGPRDDDTPPA